MKTNLLKKYGFLAMGAMLSSLSAFADEARSEERRVGKEC